MVSEISFPSSQVTITGNSPGRGRLRDRKASVHTAEQVCLFRTFRVLRVTNRTCTFEQLKFTL